MHDYIDIVIIRARWDAQYVGKSWGEGGVLSQHIRTNTYNFRVKRIVISDKS